MSELYQKRIKTLKDYNTFFEAFLRNKNVNFMGFVQAGKKCIKNIVFDTLSMDGYYLLVLVRE